MQVWIHNRHDAVRISEKPLRRCVERLLKVLGQSEAEVSIVLVDDEEIAALNRQYLNRPGPTNVLSFPMQEGEGAHITPHLLGDVVLSLDVALREARDAGISWQERLMALLIHGILHLLGRDHVRDAMQARSMEAEEERLMVVIQDELPKVRIARAP